MDNREKLQERIQLFTDAVTGKKPQRTPHFNNFWSWQIVDAGYTISEAVNDNDKMYDVVKQWLERYPEFDLIYYTCHRNPIKATTAAGIEVYEINDETNSISALDNSYMTVDEYAEVKENYLKFIWEKVIPRRATSLDLQNPMPQLLDGAREYKAFQENQGRIRKMAIEEYGMPIMNENPIGSNGYEMLATFLRGLKNISVDLRRHKEHVEETADAISELSVNKYQNAYYGHSRIAAFDTFICLVAFSMLNRKQFERLYWPYFKRMADYCETYDKTALIYQESTGKRLWDLFSELPANRFAYYPEQDDLREAKKALPNICVASGMPQSVLSTGTPQQCVDKAKELIDDLGYDGRYIFGTDKMMSFPGDCTRENLRAVCEFVHEYKG